jgi:hypothetical protein
MLAIVLASSGCAITRVEPSREDVLKKILPSAVQIVVEQHEGRRIKSGSGVAIAGRRTAEGSSCFVLTTGHTFSGLAGRTEIFAVFGRHAGEGHKACGIVSQIAVDSLSDPSGAARLIVDAPLNYGVSGAGVFDVHTLGLIGVVEGFSTAGNEPGADSAVVHRRAGTRSDAGHAARRYPEISRRGRAARPLSP